MQNPRARKGNLLWWSSLSFPVFHHFCSRHRSTLRPPFFHLQEESTESSSSQWSTTNKHLVSSTSVSGWRCGGGAVAGDWDRWDCGAQSWLRSWSGTRSSGDRLGNGASTWAWNDDCGSGSDSVGRGAVDEGRWGWAESGELRHRLGLIRDWNAGGGRDAWSNNAEEVAAVDERAVLSVWVGVCWAFYAVSFG